MESDGLQEEMSLFSTSAKASYLFILLRRGTSFKERFDNKFGKTNLFQLHALPSRI